MVPIIRPAGCRPFSTDPGKIAGPVLRTLAALLAEQLGPAQAARLSAAAGLVGQAGLVAALVTPGRPLEQFAQALDTALALVEAAPDRYRHLGSRICSAAFGARQATPAPDSSRLGRPPAIR